MKKQLAVLLALLVSSAAWGDDIHRALVHYNGPQPEKYLPALLSTLAGENLALRVVASLLPADATGADIGKEAKRFGCDVILTVQIKDESGKDRVVWVLSSPQESTPRAQGSVLKSKPDWPAAAELYWVFLGVPLSRETSPAAREWPQPPVNERTAFVIHARPGTYVVGLPEGPATVDDSGELTLSLNLPVSVLVEGHLVGVRTKPARVFVDHPDQEVTLEQTAEPRWALTAALENFTFPTFGAEWSPDAGRLVVRAFLDQYLAGILFKGKGDVASGSWPVQSWPLVSISVGAAWIWSLPEDEVRFYTAADLGVRLMFPEFRLLSYDPVTPFSLRPVAGWEYRWTDGQAVYFESGPTLSFVPKPELYMASLAENTQSFNFTLGDLPIAMAFPLQAKVGYRWSF